MSKTQKTISFTYIEPLLSVVNESNIQLDDSIAYLTDQAHKKPINISHYEVLIENILKQHQAHALAHQIITQTEMTRHDILGLLVMCGLSLKHAIKATVKFYRMQIKFITLTYNEKDNYGLIEIASDGIDGEAAHFTLFMGILAILKAKNDLIGESDHLDKVYLPLQQSEELDGLPIFSRVQIHYNQPYYAIAFHNNTLNTKLKTANQMTFEILKKQCEHTLAQQSPKQPLDTRVTHLLRDVKDMFPNMAQMAALLNMSTRTLSRQLKHYDTNYQALLDNEKIQRSKELLKLSDLSITDISNQLYFSDSSYFTKVFKKNVGECPSAYRKSV
jgi:AraC-like DNA-binding protein